MKGVMKGRLGTLSPAPLAQGTGRKLKGTCKQCFCGNQGRISSVEMPVRGRGRKRKERGKAFGNRLKFKPVEMPVRSRGENGMKGVMKGLEG